MSYENISAKKVDYYVNNPFSVFIDLREPEDYLQSHIVNAISVPFDKMEELIDNMSRNRIKINDRYYDRSYIFILYCERGSLSLIISSKLSSYGFIAKSVVGGFAQYKGKYLYES